jgi:DNA-binding MarR family transcriptional regulator
MCPYDATMAGGSDRAQAWLNLVQASRVVSDLLGEEVDRAAGLSLAEYELLLRIADTPEGRLRMVDLADLLLVSKSGVTRLVDRLEETGFVTRAFSTSDRRLTLATITGAGREALGRAYPAFAGALDRSFSRHLADRDVTCLRTALRKVLQGNGVWEEQRCSAEFAAHDPTPAGSSKPPERDGAARTAPTGSP